MIGINNQRMAAFLLVITCCMSMPVYLTANQTEVTTEQDIQNESSENTALWYEQESTQKIASGVLAAAVITYAVAVYMNKISSPVEFFNALWFPKSADTQTPDKQPDNQQQDINTGDINQNNISTEDVSGQNDQLGDTSEQTMSDDIAHGDVENNTRPIDRVMDRFFAWTWEKYEAWKEGSKRFNENYPI